LKHKNKLVLVFSKFFSWETNRSLSIKDSIEARIGMLRLFILFSQILSTGVRYKAKRMGKRNDLCSTLILVWKEGEVKLFQIYCIYLPIR